MSAKQPQKSQAKQHLQAKCTQSYSKFRQRRQGTQQYGKRDQLHEIDYEDDDYDPDMDFQFKNFVIEILDINQNGIKDEIHVTALIDNTSFEIKVDSGAKCNVISTEPITALALFKKPQLNTKNKVNLVTYSQDTIETMGKCLLNYRISGVTSPIKL